MAASHRHACILAVAPAVNCLHCGTGVLIGHFTADGLVWAIDQAMASYGQPLPRRSSHIRRIMTDSLVQVDATEMVRRIIDLYTHLLSRPLMPLPAGPESPPASQIAA